MPVSTPPFQCERGLRVRLNAMLVPAALLTASLALIAQPPAKSSVAPEIKKTIVVDEGTNLAIAISPDHKTIVMDLQGLLYALPMGGGKARQLTTAVEECSHPSWSPNGDLIAVQSYRGGTFHIWTMRPDGTGFKQITSGHGDDREPSFSPDGKTIAFSSDRAFKGSYDIWAVDVATSALTQWTNSAADEYEPAWSPDGKRIAFVKGVIVPGAIGASVQGKTIETLDSPGGESTTVAKAGNNSRLDAPSWSPDGSHLAYTQFFGAGLFVSAARLMVDGQPIKSANDDAFPFPAVWLSANELVYTANGHIVKADLASETDSIIPFSAAIESVRPQYRHKVYSFDSAAPRQVKGILAPALSPDGTRVAFTALNQLWTMKIGSKPRQITHDSFYKQSPAWSPDGKWLAYVSDKDGTENIYLLNLSTGEEKPLSLTDNSAQIFPAWSPDGKWIAFQDQTGATLIAEVATGKIRPLAPSTFFPGRPGWSADGSTIAIATVKPYTKRFREGTSQILMVDVASGKTKFFEPAPFESVTTRTEDGPVYSPNGKEMAFVMDDLLYTMPVDAHGLPSGPASKLNDETTDAPTWSGDSSKLLYLHDGVLHIISRATRQITPVPVDLTYTLAKPQQELLIHAGRFWKGEGPDEQKDVDILISGNRIESITPHASTPPPGVRVVDASNLTVMPGLWENHAHPDAHNSIYYGDRMGRLWLAYGVTELRDMAGNAYRAEESREALDSGAAIGPRLFPTGEAIDGERVYYSMMIPTTSEAQLYRELNRLKALDFDLVKLYVRLPYAWMVKGEEFAHQQMGVVTASHYLLPAVDLGVDGMAHISATARTGYAYSRSLTGVSYEDVRKLLSESGMFTMSTLLNMSPYSLNPTMPEDPRYQIAPPWERMRLAHARDIAVATDQSEGMDRVKDEEATVAADFRAGGLILAGTDSPLDLPATSLHLNLRMQVKFGLEPWQALETVTFLPAKAYGLTRDLGTLEKGKLADLILVSGDPLTNIDDTANVQCVMKNGNLMSVSEVAKPFVSLPTGADVCPAE
jgi:Tol biopolymer transport system component/imidazolonepropionase-like amidohydrolase